MADETDKTNEITLPLLASDPLIFPHCRVMIDLPFNPLFAESIEWAMNHDRRLFYAVQKQSEAALQPEDDDRQPKRIIQEIYQVGCYCRIEQVIKNQRGKTSLLLQGEQRALISDMETKEKTAFVRSLPLPESEVASDVTAPFMKLIREDFSQYTLNHNRSLRPLNNEVQKAEFPNKLVDLIAGNLKTPFDIQLQLQIFQTTDTLSRLRLTAELLQSELELSHLKQKISNKVRYRLDKRQRDYYLSEQIREINKEMGRTEDEEEEVSQFYDRLNHLTLPEEVLTKAKKEIARYASLPQMSPDSGILRFYIEWLLDMPWGVFTEDSTDLTAAQRILDEDHFDLKTVKERILDYIAVTQLKNNVKGPILCFVGPPGTGKTSLARSVARALNKKFVRISLGGIRDEAVIRGHRRTYIGALPGKIIQSIKKAGSQNPVFLLDEIDKMSSDIKGDPASAMLEVLDPEQNFNFVDHYLEVPFDLSNILFIATANSADNIPKPLLDRMEIIEVPGYTDIEKRQIANRFIIPKQLKANGLEWASIHFRESAVNKIISDYTMESGVRNLEKNIGAVIRKTARRAIEHRRINVEALKAADSENSPHFSETITPKKVEYYLGTPKYNRDLLFATPRVGNINGLAWTEYGGAILPVETALFDGKEAVILTGNLGKVMQESARIAISLLQSQQEALCLPKDFSKKKSIHIHVPEGAIPKDGPSAGITMMASIYSAFADRLPLPLFALTGEISLTGMVLPIGGLKAKTLAAYRNGIHHIILPQKNIKEVEDLPKEVRNAIQFHPVSNAGQVLAVLFGDPQQGGSDGNT